MANQQTWGDGFKNGIKLRTIFEHLTEEDLKASFLDRGNTSILLKSPVDKQGFGGSTAFQNCNSMHSLGKLSY